MSKLKAVYHYCSFTQREQANAVVSHGQSTLTISHDGSVACELIRRGDLDGPTSRYFTSPIRAIEAFVKKAEAAIADPAKAEHHAGWRQALTAAQARLSEITNNNARGRKAKTGAQ